MGFGRSEGTGAWVCLLPLLLLRLPKSKLRRSPPTKQV